MDLPLVVLDHQIYNWTTLNHIEYNSMGKPYRLTTGKIHRKFNSVSILILFTLIVIYNWPTLSTTWVRRLACTRAASDPSCLTVSRMPHKSEITEINQSQMPCRLNWSRRKIKAMVAFNSLVVVQTVDLVPNTELLWTTKGQTITVLTMC